MLDTILFDIMSPAHLHLTRFRAHPFRITRPLYWNTSTTDLTLPIVLIRAYFLSRMCWNEHLSAQTAYSLFQEITSLSFDFGNNSAQQHDVGHCEISISIDVIVRLLHLIPGFQLFDFCLK